MLSKKAEERNEKIIRGLMKLPPNRRCINCNTVGPQYVCTNFWTFVCMNCSGIHREFTHRVKSVSMSKFTSQEVEALQRGGNQRAREIFLNDWDPLRHKFPNGSNADKVREFIKNVYVDRRYATGNTSKKPLRILQDPKKPQDMPRRASSYQLYSESPPYDYIYEERGYGKQAFVLVRKAGLDGFLKTSGSFSPSRLAGSVNEENFADDYSNSRSSNYSTSTASSPYRSSNQSPYTQRSIKFSSSSSETSRERVNAWNQKVNTFLEKNSNLDVGRTPYSQRTSLNSNFASFSSSSMPFSSENSENDSGTRKVSGIHSKVSTFLPSPSSSVSRNHDSPDLIDTVFASQTVTHSTSEHDLFQSPKISSNLSIDLFQPSSMSLISTESCPELSRASQSLSSDQKAPMETKNQKSSGLVNQQNGRWVTSDGPQNMEPNQGSQSFTVTSSTSDSDMFQSPEISSNLPIDLFQLSSMSLISTASCLEQSLASQPLSSDQKAPMTTLNQKSSSLVNQQNHRWATFDGPQNMDPGQGSQSFNITSSTSDSNMFQSAEISSNLPLDLFQPSSMSLISTASCLEVSPASQPLSSDQKASMPTLNEESSDLFNQQNGRWETFAGPQNMEPGQGGQNFTGADINFNKGGSISDADQHLFQNTNQQWNAFYDYSAQVTYPSMPVHWHGSQQNSFSLPSGINQAGALLSTTNRTSTNPFDIAYESNPELSNTFLDMSSLQGVLPDRQMPIAYSDGVTDPWFTQNSVATYVPTRTQGTFGLYGEPVQSAQLASFTYNESVAPVGGNPFA